jgi:ElaB/YqjD/DUF883 family membrane-anchored ribosome-binding protein
MTSLKTRAEEATAYVKDNAESLSRDVARTVGERAEHLRDATTDVMAAPMRSVRRHPQEWGLILVAAAVAVAATVYALRRRR